MIRHPLETLSPSPFVSATSDASSLLIPCTRRSLEQPRCWGGDVRVQKFYGKRSRNQLSSAWDRGWKRSSPYGIERCGVMVSFIYGVVDLTDMCILRDHLTDMCKGTARGRPTRGKKDV
ncbi:hypothetical protein E6C27_scaffold157G00050 [Cucumis melo var. makuwa]|uniref:Ty3-gypsy retrotransposon protein n=2 Tax=Cucumis melo TaxID=3656 RepID=A0A5A7TSP9_CUCMM|nr:hypothetical protein E6C27_scaffold157G00050 [Cucumis melo var. makuwa]